MILIDYNAIAISNIVTQKLAIDENLIRHMILKLSYSIFINNNSFKALSNDTSMLYYQGFGGVDGKVSGSKHLFLLKRADGGIEKVLHDCVS